MKRHVSVLCSLVALAFVALPVAGCLGATDDCALFYNCGAGGARTDTGGNSSAGGVAGAGGVGGTGGLGGTGGAPPACDDGDRNGGESDIDCGKVCPEKCSDGQACGTAEDCISNVCGRDKICKPAGCGDGTQNGGESAIDCGGPTCDPCGPGETCDQDTDCAGNECDTGICKANCQDGVQNNGESDIDCGSVIGCPGCDNGKTCVVGADCTSGQCPAPDGVCCDSLCGGECVACLEAKTGKANGTCAPIKGGEDPDNECPDLPSSPCATTGICSAFATCALYACMPANAVGACDNGACLVGSCNSGYADCDGNDGNGCEANVSADVANCGACGRACSGDHVASKSCSGGTCNSTCDPGWANCQQPGPGANDDGCELDVLQNNDNCGGCGNSCSQQGGSGNDDFECDGGFSGQQYCTCDTDVECDGDGPGIGAGTCIGSADKVCTCGGTNCRPGEACIWDLVGLKNVCSCNDGAPCGANQTCCDTPAGCFDLSTNAQSCGACGHACPPGFTCAAGACRCDSDADCNAGTAQAFTCNAALGICSCNGVQCAAGDRCQPDGTCG